MINKSMILAMLFFVAACASQESKFADYLKKNPKMIFDAIEENSEQFVEAVNRAARKAQEVQYKKQESEKLRQQEQQLKNPLNPSLSEQSLLFGSLNSPIVIVEYADFQCPACRMGYNSLMKLKDKFIESDMLEFQNFGFTGTPVLIVNGVAMPGAQPLEEIEKVIELTTKIK